MKLGGKMALGRGLGELLGEVETAYENSNSNSNSSGVKKIEVALIDANPNQQRKKIKNLN